MKGLLIKDFRYLLNMRKFFGMLIAMVLLFSFMGIESSFFIGYIVMLANILVLNTLSYDDQQKGMSFLMTLPVTGKTFALEKYVYSILTTIIGITCAVICNVAMCRLKGLEMMNARDLMAVCLLMYLVTCIGSSVLIPLLLKYGVEKGRVALLIFVFACIIIVTSLGKQEGLMGEFQNFYFQYLEGNDMMIAIGLVVICAIVHGISFLCSSAILAQKEY